MYTKTITPHYEEIKRGKGRKTIKRFVGYLGELHDGETLIHSAVYDYNGAAEVALDALAFELLSDLAEQGLIDELPAFDPSTCCFCHKPHAAQDCAEMRARLFAPFCATCGNDGDCPDCAPAKASVIQPLDCPHGDDCPWCARGILVEDHALLSAEYIRTVEPIDVDFAPTGFEV